MGNTSGSWICAGTCWGIALLGGFLGAALLMVLAGWSFVQAVFAGGVLFIFAGLVLSWLLCRPLPAPGTVSIAPKTADATPKKAATRPAPAAAPSPAAEAAVVVKSTQLPGQDELSARKGEWKYDGAAAPAADAAPAEAPANDASPETLSGPRDGGADNLKLLKGVGPKLEGTLNELGFYHFDQIAKWTAEDVAWVDTRLKFKGRIERDGWIEQAKILAAGGDTEFSKKSK